MSARRWVWSGVQRKPRPRKSRLGLTGIRARRGDPVVRQASQIALEAHDPEALTQAHERDAAKPPTAAPRATGGVVIQAQGAIQANQAAVPATTVETSSTGGRSRASMG